jgi:hypothetical protein
VEHGEAYGKNIFHEGRARRYLCNDVSIGVDEANDFIFGELQNALRRQRLTISARSPPLFRLPRCHPRRCSSPVRMRHNFSV